VGPGKQGPNSPGWSRRRYELISLEVNEDWQFDTKQHVFNRHVGATADLRYGMALNTHMQVYIYHGRYDMVTSYFASSRLVASMKLPLEPRARITVDTFDGGHMFYAWEASQAQFSGAIGAFVAWSLAPAGNATAS